MTCHSKTECRQKMRAKRQALSARDILHASNQLGHNILQHPDIKAANKIAITLAINNEIKLGGVVRPLTEAGKILFVPAIDQHDTLTFKPYTDTTPCRRNRHQILEPIAPQHKIAQQLDIILVPGIAFSAHGHRIGYGKGYYDRCLSACNNTYKPKCFGVCYAWQILPSLPQDDWDIVLDGIISS